MTLSIAGKLDGQIKAVCPIHGVSMGRKNDKATWRIDFNGATDAEKAAAQAVVDGFDPIQEQADADATAKAARKSPPAPNGNSIPALRDELAALQQKLIDAGVLDA